MNKLSLILWLSDVLPNLGSAATVFAVVFTVAAVLSTALGVILFSTYSSDQETIERVRKRLLRTAFVLWPLVVLLLATSIVTPSRNTVLAIAASEAAETIAATPAAQEIMGETLAVIRSWLHAAAKGNEKK